MTLRPVDVDAMQRAKDNLAYDTQPGALPTVWYWPDDGYDSIKRVDAATVRALATTIAALQRENVALRAEVATAIGQNEIFRRALSAARADLGTVAITKSRAKADYARQRITDVLGDAAEFAALDPPPAPEGDDMTPEMVTAATEFVIATGCIVCLLMLAWMVVRR